MGGGISIPVAHISALAAAGGNARARHRSEPALALSVHPRGALLGSNARGVAAAGGAARHARLPRLWTRRLLRLGTVLAQSAILAARDRLRAARRMAAADDHGLEA